MEHHPELKSHHVILYVNTDEISEGNEKGNCWLQRPFATKWTNEDFYTQVDLGEWITWSGVSISSPNDIVNITSIRYEKGSNVFGKELLHGDGKTPEKVIGTIFNDNGDKKENYIISFTVINVNNGGERNGSFRVDPVIRVRPPGGPV